MTRLEAAKALGISPRTLDNYTSKGLLRVQYIKGRRGQKVDISPEEIESFRPLLAQMAGKPLGQQPEPPPVTTLAIPYEASQTLQPDMLQYMADMHVIAESVRAGQDKDTVPIADRFLITPDEAAVLAGVSAHSIRTAIKDGTLPARKQGRGWKIRPADARAWVDRMFEP